MAFRGVEVKSGEIAKAEVHESGNESFIKVGEETVPISSHSLGRALDSVTEGEGEGEGDVKNKDVDNDKLVVASFQSINACVQLRLAVGESFNLEKTVCNHGFFMMSPNVWIPSIKSLRRPLRLADASHSLHVTISHPNNDSFLLIQIHGIASLSLADQTAILNQVARMLRISDKDENDVREFQKLNASAMEKGFGRIFRSPSLFEDVVKSIILCNCGWKRTLTMARDLCALQLQLANGDMKRKRKRLNSTNIENFPNSKELVCVDQKYLNERCNLGYRAEIILRLATMIENGKLDLNKLEQASDDSTTLYAKLMKIKGFGPFVCSNIMMCLGFYERIPSDSETVRHLKMVHGLKKCCKKSIEKDVKEIYGKNAPFQCIAYWMGLVDEYESKVGKLSELESCKYHSVTGSHSHSHSN